MSLRLGGGSREHDYTSNMWGHALHSPAMIDVVERPSSLWQKWFGKPVTSRVLQCLGHGAVRPGDTLLLKMASGCVARFKAVEIEYFGNPDDMFNLKRADFVEYVGAASAGETTTTSEGGMNDLLELAERCEKATGPDRGLDAEIAAALHVKQADLPIARMDQRPQVYRIPRRRDVIGGTEGSAVPHEDEADAQTPSPSSRERK